MQEIEDDYKNMLGLTFNWVLNVIIVFTKWNRACHFGSIIIRRLLHAEHYLRALVLLLAFKASFIFVLHEMKCAFSQKVLLSEETFHQVHHLKISNICLPVN